MDRLEDDVDELFAMEVRDCNCSINSSFEFSTSEEKSDSDYVLPEKKVHKVNPDEVMCVKKKSGNKKAKPSSCKGRRN
jgi:hypothetical protein